MTLWPLSLLGFWIWASPAYSLTSFDTNCTIPNQTYGYVQGPNTRGSLQIVWSCLATLIACTYTILHLNVPEQRNGTEGGVEDYLWKGTRPGLLRAALTTMAPTYTLFNEKLLSLAEHDSSVRTELSWWGWNQASTTVWMLLAMIAPEFYATMGFRSLVDAWKTKAALRELPLATCIHPAHGFTLTHAFFAHMRGFAIQVRNEGNPRQIIHLTARSLLELLRHESTRNTINLLPNQEDIEDRSKSDAFIKGVIVLQIGYFTLSCILRLASGLSITQLEMSVFGTAVCSLMTYLALFEKPHRVKTPFILLTFPGRVPEHIRSVLELSGTRTSSSPSIISDSDWRDHTRIILMLYILPSVLGAFHVAAWNFEFALAVDRWIWRSAFLVSCAVVPLGWALLSCLAIISSIAGMEDSTIEGVLISVTMYGAIVLYCLSRVVIVVEMI